MLILKTKCKLIMTELKFIIEVNVVEFKFLYIFLVKNLLKHGIKYNTIIKLKFLTNSLGFIGLTPNLILKTQLSLS